MLQTIMSSLTAHPRMRGEHSRDGGMMPAAMGSSPHARGAPQRLLSRLLPPGLIPACAGSADQHQGHRRVHGLIPACAGSTARATATRSPRGAHPRMRGEHRKSGRATVFGPWLIPACAGSTRYRPCRPPRTPAHPRMRGEHVHLTCERCGTDGSSPHARGAQGPSGPLTPRLGLIPACAGSTIRWHTDRDAVPAHPRMRGEHPSSVVIFPVRSGSSPHARGAPGRQDRGVLRAGLIPACAGSTSPSRRRGGTGGAHPRMRGEHCERVATRSRRTGSSPHARGAPPPTDNHSRPAGLIPACAGSTGA